MTDFEKINVSTKLTDSGNVDWRILAIDDEEFHLIQLNIQGRIVRHYSKEDFYSMLADGRLTVAADQEFYVVNYDVLPPNQKLKLEERRGFIKDIKKTFGPSYEAFYSQRCRDQRYIEICCSHALVTTEACLILNKWLQSGFQDSALTDKRYYKGVAPSVRVFKVKPGRKSLNAQGKLLTEQDKKYFDEAVRMYTENELLTIHKAYVILCSAHYSFIDDNGNLKLLPPDEVPTEAQFIYYLREDLGIDSRKEIKARRSAYIRNDRTLNSTTCFDIPGPGHTLECDALEIDLQIVSTINREKCVGKPILYMLIDVYSKCIVAAYVSFNNNSKIALRGLLANLVEDKVEACARHGITLTQPELWPSEFIPRVIRTDNGSDFISNWMDEVCKDTGIEVSHEPPACGSMKGNIERSFHSFHDSFKPELLYSGVITGQYGNKPKEEAIHDINSVYNLVINFILFHNSAVRKAQHLRKFMKRSLLEPSPINFWKDGIDYAGEPNYVLPSTINQFLFSIMEKDRGTIQRKQSIRWHGLEYDINREDDPTLMARAEDYSKNTGKVNKETGNIVNSLDIRFDPCSINDIFYLHNSKVITLHLSKRFNPDYEFIVDMTLEEYDNHKKGLRPVDNENRRKRLTQEIICHTEVDRINRARLESAPAFVDTNHIKENRMIERNNVNFSERLGSKMLTKEEMITESPKELISDYSKNPIIEDARFSSESEENEDKQTKETAYDSENVSTQEIEKESVSEGKNEKPLSYKEKMQRLLND